MATKSATKKPTPLAPTKKKKKSSTRLSSADRRAQLIATACTVFARRGYEAASMEEVAREAGVTKPIVYDHFGGKEGLYAVVLDREIRDVVARVEAGVAEGGPRDRFAGAVVAYLTYVTERPDGFRILAADGPGRNGVSQVVDTVSGRVGEVFAAELKRLRLDPKLSGLYANALIGMVTQVGRWRFDNESMPLDDVAKHVIALGWMGLRHLPKVPKL